jgi:hypothetical protein
MARIRIMQKEVEAPEALFSSLVPGELFKRRHGDRLCVKMDSRYRRNITTICSAVVEVNYMQLDNGACYLLKDNAYVVPMIGNLEAFIDYHCNDVEEDGDDE